MGSSPIGGTKGSCLVRGRYALGELSNFAEPGVRGRDQTSLLSACRESYAQRQGGRGVEEGCKASRAGNSWGRSYRVAKECGLNRSHGPLKCIAGRVRLFMALNPA